MVEKCTLFSQLSEKEKEVLKEFLEPVFFKEGEIIFDEFQRADSIFFIYEGVIGLYRSDNFGRWTKVAIVYKGAPLGECAFFLQKPHSLRAVAERPLKALKLTREKAEVLKEKFPSLYLKLLEKILAVMSQRLKSEDAKYSQICGFFSVPGGQKWRS
ncbi:Crp/Fnr family transcriptional regulator [Thermovibrio sp.]